MKVLKPTEQKLKTKDTIPEKQLNEERLNEIDKIFKMKNNYKEKFGLCKR